MRGIATRGATLAFGEFGVKAVGCGWLTSSQIEAARRTITHSLKRGGKIWIRVFPDKPKTQKSQGVRMGGGKGEVVTHVAVVKPGRVLFEVAGVSKEAAFSAFEKASGKIPFATKFIWKGRVFL